MVDSSTWFCFETLRWYWCDSTRFLMRTWSSVVENGLVRKSLAPADKAASLVSSSARAVSRTMGMLCVGVCSRISRQACNPSFSGIIMSSRMMSGRNWLAFSIACWPSTASSTW